MSTGSARPLEDAFRIAQTDLVNWLVSDHDLALYGRIPTDQPSGGIAARQCLRHQLHVAGEDPQGVAPAAPRPFRRRAQATTPRSVEPTSQRGGFGHTVNTRGGEPDGSASTAAGSGQMPQPPGSVASTFVLRRPRAGGPTPSESRRHTVSCAHRLIRRGKGLRTRHLIRGFESLRPKPSAQKLSSFGESPATEPCLACSIVSITLHPNFRRHAVADADAHAENVAIDGVPGDRPEPARFRSSFVWRVDRHAIQYDRRRAQRRRSCRAESPRAGGGPLHRSVHPPRRPGHSTMTFVIPPRRLGIYSGRRRVTRHSERTRIRATTSLQTRRST